MDPRKSSFFKNSKVDDDDEGMVKYAVVVEEDLKEDKENDKTVPHKQKKEGK